MKRKILQRLVLVVTILTASLPMWAAKQSDGHIPVALVYGAVAAGESGSSSPQMFTAFVDQLKETGRMDVVVFSPKLPAVVQSVHDNRLSADTLSKPGDSKAEIEIGKAVNADYVLHLAAGVEPDFEGIGKDKKNVGSKVQFTVEVADLHNGKKWTCGAGSRITFMPYVKEDLSRENSISTASSDVVTQIMLQLFGPSAVLNPKSTPSAPATSAVEVVRDTTGEYKETMGRAAEYASRGDIANAIVQLRGATNLQPASPEPRLKLATIYLDRGMTREAADECKGILLFHGDNAAALDMLSKISVANGNLAQAADDYREMARLNPGNANIRVGLGDIYWNLSKIDDAEKEYIEAEKIAPNTPMAYARLAKLYRAKRKYGPALDQAFQQKLVALGASPKPSAVHGAVGSVVIDEIQSTLNRLNSSDDEYLRRTLTREGYYQECKDDEVVIDALDKFLSGQSVPDNLKSAHSHLALAVALLSQANSSEINYLETEKQHYADEAGSLRSEAKGEADLYVKALSRS